MPGCLLWHAKLHSVELPTVLFCVVGVLLTRSHHFLFVTMSLDGSSGSTVMQPTHVLHPQSSGDGGWLLLLFLEGVRLADAHEAQMGRWPELGSRSIS